MASGNKNSNTASSNADLDPLRNRLANITLPSGFNTPGGFGIDPLSAPQDTILGDDPATAGARAYKNSQQTGPYRGGLLTNFNRRESDPFKRGYQNYAAAFDQDADVRGAAAAKDELDNPNSGTNSAEQQALYNMYLGRINTKNSLAESIQGNAANERKSEDLLTGAAGQALGEGLKNTRQNYNSRGLLYSGLRQGGEQQVRQGVASGLDSAISGSRREAANSLSAAQNAYAAVDLANAQESLQLAHQAFDTASANNIARMQAMQQLGRGVGGVVGTIAGSYSGGSQPAGPSGPSNYNTASTGNYYDGTGSNYGSVA